MTDKELFAKDFEVDNEISVTMYCFALKYILPYLLRSNKREIQCPKNQEFDNSSKNQTLLFLLDPSDL